MKIRLRPDIAVLKPLPNPETYTFCTGSCSTRGEVYFPYAAIFAVGAEDSMNIGRAADMDLVLDRYINLITGSYIFYQNPASHTTQWNSESHLAGILKESNITLKAHGEIWMLKVRATVRQKHALSSSPGSLVEWKQALH